MTSPGNIITVIFTLPAEAEVSVWEPRRFGIFERIAREETERLKGDPSAGFHTIKGEGELFCRRELYAPRLAPRSEWSFDANRGFSGAALEDKMDPPSSSCGITGANPRAHLKAPSRSDL